MAALHFTPPDHDLELLSAYLDGELSNRERISLEQRLNRDPDLRTALDELRNTIAMVHDLPRLKAPRNFTLDPAIYSRPVPWWKRLFTINNTLQLSGALGAVAAILIIASAFLFNGDADRNDSTVPQPAFDQASEPNAAAMLSTATGALLTTAALDGEHATAIANANTDAVAFEATLDAQSAWYASTEILGTMTAESFYWSATASRTRVTAPPPEPSVLDSADAQSNVVGEAVAGTSEDVQEVTTGAEEGLATEMDVPFPQETEGPMILQAQSPSGDGDTASGVFTTEPAFGMIEPVPAAGDVAMREKETSTSSSPTATATRTMLPTPTLLPSSTPAHDITSDEAELIIPISPTPVAYAPQNAPLPAQTNESERVPGTEPEIKRHNESQGGSGTITWLAGLGAAILVVSLALFVVGRRRSQHT